MRCYGVIAQDTELEHNAIEIRLRAERRLGEMIGQQKAGGLLSRGAAGSGINQYTEVRSDPPTAPPNQPAEVRSTPPTAPITLADAGISKDLSARAQNIAAVPEQEFEQEISEFRERTKQDGKQVQTRLNERGRAVRGKPAQQKAEAVAESTELIELRAKVEALEEWGAANAKTAKELLEENASMQKVFDADDKVKAAMAEAKRYREMNRILEERIRGMQNETLAAKKSAQTWQRRADKAEKSNGKHAD
jgi:hypothetical protein